MAVNVYTRLLAQLMICFLTALIVVDGKKEFETTLTESDQDESRVPQKMKLKLKLDNDDVELDLEHNSHISNTVPVIIARRRRLMPWSSRDSETYSFYTDKAKNATVSVRAKSQGNGKVKRTYLGTFRKDDRDYTLLPKKDVPKFSGRPADGERIERGEDGNEDGSEVDEGLYVVSEESLTTDDLGGNTNTSFRNNSNPSFKFRTDLLTWISADQASAVTKQSYGVEMLMVIDFAIYKKWLDASEKLLFWQREEEAINNIRYYYSHIANGMDLRYSNIDEDDFDIYVKLSGFYIATTEADSPFTEGEGIRDIDEDTDVVYTHAYKSLDYLEEWLEDYQNDLPYFDQASLFVGNVVFGGYYTDGGRRRIAGLATISGVCMKGRVSVNQENGPYATTQTATHEMGHNLGAYHDISGEGCTKADQFIMASAPTSLSEETLLNAYNFSRCSVDDFREQIKYLNALGMNCMLNTTHNRVNQTEVEIHLQRPPGQVFSLDEQCMLIYGPDSKYCGGGHYDSKMCQKLYCYDPVYDGCRTRVEQRAANGTSCGNKKWCMFGKCTSDVNAPEGLDVCISGDFKGEFSDGNTCEVLVRNKPHLCYQDYYYDSCCASCDRIQNNSWPACRYGDRYDWCQRSVNARDCYSESTAASCCESCRKFYTGVKDCEYGNRADWCATIRSSSCYVSSDTCCLACLQKDTGPPGCQYGDRASWCDDVMEKPHQCYSENTRNLCCQSCPAAHTGIAGCPYGDQSQYCEERDCDDSNRLDRCCYTCRHKLGYTFPPKTTSTTPVPTTTTTRRATTTTTLSTTTTPEECLDHARWCDGLPRSYCYLNGDICCKTCEALYKPNKGCEYGDHKTWCVDLTEKQCQGEDHKKECCVSCADDRVWETTTTTSTTTSTTTTTPTITTTTPATTRPKTTTTTTTTTVPPTTTTQGNSGTTFPPCDGDEAEWCSKSHPGVCYTDWDVCCGSCINKFYLGIPGCEYGNEYSWCENITLDRCRHPSYNIPCCLTCASYDKSSSTLPAITTTPPPTTTTTTQPPTTPTECTREASWCPRQKSNICYKDHAICCKTCNTVYYTGEEGCEYGDKQSWCDELQSRDCYHSSYREPCCKTCPLFHTGIQGCEFGDRLRDCSNAVCTENYFIERCCLTCSKNNTASPTTTTSTTTLPTTTPPDCEDTKDWCKTVKPNECYYEAFIGPCCATCQKYAAEGKPGCEFGDKLEDCGTVDCSDNHYKERCCATCAGRTTTTTTTTTTTKRPTTTTTTSTTTPTTTTTTAPPTTTTTTPTTTTTKPTTTTAIIDCMDSQSWCNTVLRRDCYHESFKDPCCSTCQQHALSGWPGCLYGDRLRDCSEADCSRQYFLDNCCETCSKPTTPTTTTTTTQASTVPADCEDTRSWCDTVKSRECYYPTFRDPCCATCQAFAASGRPGCPFGDKISTCATRDCISQYNLEHCCATCNSNMTATTTTTKTTTTTTPATTTTTSVHPACKNLASDSYCAALVPGDCYFESYMAVCCETCTRHYTGVEECPYGDKNLDCTNVDCDITHYQEYCCLTCLYPHLQPTTTTPRTTTVPVQADCVDHEDSDYCSALSPDDCYFQTYRLICCGTCQAHFTGIGGCEYGDKVSWCPNHAVSVKTCERQDIGPNCCRTCYDQYSLRLGEDEREVAEGSIIGIDDSSYNKVATSQLQLIEKVRVIFNQYCNTRPKDCCKLHNLSFNTSTFITSDLFTPEDVKVAKGFPRVAGKKTNHDVWTKLVVTVQTMNLEEYCGKRQRTQRRLPSRPAPGSLRHPPPPSRTRRDATSEETFFVDKKLLYRILNEHKDSIKQTVSLNIETIQLPPEDGNFLDQDNEKSNVTTKEDDAWKIALGVVCPLLVIAISIAVFIFFKVWRKRRTYNEENCTTIASTSSIGSSGQLSLERKTPKTAPQVAKAAAYGQPTPVLTTHLQTVTSNVYDNAWIMTTTSRHSLNRPSMLLDDAPLIAPPVTGQSARR